MSSDIGRVWLVTGASRGLGRCLAETALENGDRVLLAVRDFASVADLVKKSPKQAASIRLDVSKQAGIPAAIMQAEEVFGPIDILVNNAGYVVIGAVEEVDPATYRAVFETNFFGSLEIIRNLMPSMRRRRAGHILTMSAMGGFVPGAGLAYYCATKAALELISEALAQEVEPLGIKVTIIQPGNFRTGVLDARVEAQEIADYGGTAGALRRKFAGASGKQPGDPNLAAKVIFAVTREEKPPLWLPLGPDAVERIDARLHRLEKSLARTREVAHATTFEQ